MNTRLLLLFLLCLPLESTYSVHPEAPREWTERHRTERSIGEKSVRTPGTPARKMGKTMVVVGFLLISVAAVLAVAVFLTLFTGAAGGLALTARLLLILGGLFLGGGLLFQFFGNRKKRQRRRAQTAVERQRQRLTRVIDVRRHHIRHRSEALGSYARRRVNFLARSDRFMVHYRRHRSTIAALYVGVALGFAALIAGIFGMPALMILGGAFLLFFTVGLLHTHQSFVDAYLLLEDGVLRDG